MGARTMLTGTFLAEQTHSNPPSYTLVSISSAFDSLDDGPRKRPVAATAGGGGGGGAGGAASAVRRARAEKIGAKCTELPALKTIDPLLDQSEESAFIAPARRGQKSAASAPAGVNATGSSASAANSPSATQIHRGSPDVRRPGGASPDRPASSAGKRIARPGLSSPLASTTPRATPLAASDSASTATPSAARDPASSARGSAAGAANKSRASAELRPDAALASPAAVSAGVPAPAEGRTEAEQARMEALEAENAELRRQLQVDEATVASGRQSNLSPSPFVDAARPSSKASIQRPASVVGRGRGKSVAIATPRQRPNSQRSNKPTRQSLPGETPYDPAEVFTRLYSAQKPWMFGKTDMELLSYLARRAGDPEIATLASPCGSPSHNTLFPGMSLMSSPSSMRSARKHRHHRELFDECLHRAPSPDGQQDSQQLASPASKDWGGGRRPLYSPQRLAKAQVARENSARLDEQIQDIAILPEDAVRSYFEAEELDKDKRGSHMSKVSSDYHSNHSASGKAHWRKLEDAFESDHGKW